MRILHVVNISFVIPYFLGQQLNWFHQKGYEEYVVCSDSEELESFSKKYSFSYKAIDVLRKISIKKDLMAVYKTVKYIKQIKADIVVGHTPKGGLVAMLAAFLAHVPIRIYFRHGLVYETSKGIKRFILMNVDRFASLLATKIVCVSPSVAERSLEDKLNSSRKQVVLLNGSCNGVDIERFSKDKISKEIISATRMKYGINENDFVIGFTGRIVRDKGVIDLINAFDILKEKYSNIKLMLVGMLEERDAIPQETIKKIEEDKSIIALGYINNSEIEKYYALMDVMILPSYREGLGMSLLEASSMGIPVIGTRVTGVVDAVVENETGFFVNHDEKDIAEKISYLIDNPSERERMGRNGKEMVATKFRQELVWKEIEKLYIEK